jgi:hypothetical protein
MVGGSNKKPHFPPVKTSSQFCFILLISSSTESESYIIRSIFNIECGWGGREHFLAQRLPASRWLLDVWQLGVAAIIKKSQVESGSKKLIVATNRCCYC